MHPVKAEDTTPPMDFKGAQLRHKKLEKPRKHRGKFKKFFKVRFLSSHTL